jgi:hypothetical protein
MGFLAVNRRRYRAGIRNLFHLYLPPAEQERVVPSRFVAKCGRTLKRMGTMRSTL